MSVRNQVNFAIIPEWILYGDVSAQAVRLYGVLNRYANKERQAWPARSELAKLLRVKSPRTVDSALDELKEIGAITVKPRHTKRGDQTSNLYVVNVTPKGAQQIAMGVAADDATPLAADDALNESHIEREPVNESKSLAPQAARKRDVVFEAVADVCGIDWQNGLTAQARGPLNTAAKQLRDVGASAAEVRRRASNWPSLFPDATLTPTALAKHWPQLARARAPTARPDRILEMGQSLDNRLQRVREEGTDGPPGGAAHEARRGLPPG